ncbi:hypothetical protein Poli38472_008961 [Pythium oligandrum]|uniref:Mitochondrial ribonuclease P catalytic subunit n=1 Tax=Pythium oligandrum TaxID=41045 RepID=A0A8K1CJM4_PYTOL|nr:hypothetical protein Poli38472_008961 [Pythium oligandrum]|eukprot:TMW64794.1 hypothetical protein Poli38472_008961 [Pythium oligandrum]
MTLGTNPMAMETSAASKRPASEVTPAKDQQVVSKKRARRLNQQTPEEKALFEAKKKIEQAARDADAANAVTVYQDLKTQGLAITPYLYRVVLNVCASSADAGAYKDAAFGVFEDYKQHPEAASGKNRIDETMYSALIKICAKSKNLDDCRNLLISMEEAKIEPRLRTYSSLLSAYSEEGNLEQALWVHEQLRKHALEPTESEYVALFRACVSTGNADQFYMLLNEYIDAIEQPGAPAWEVFKEWFASDAAKVHGRGWKCSVGSVSDQGISSVNGDQLISLELPEEDASALLAKIESLVRTDEKRIEQWAEFKAWLDEHGPFEILIDAANVGYFAQNYSGGGFSYKQIESMYRHYEAQGKKTLIVLHKRRTYDDQVPTEYRETLKTWLEQNVMYNCRSGNNDDWYWLYAAVKLGGRTLMVTNDEMRDHHFQMIHNRSFTRWKERHQVHYSIHWETQVKVNEPSVYSVRPQRVGDNWHFPSSDPSSSEWLCFQLEPEKAS